MNFFQTYYEKVIIQDLINKFNYKNNIKLPKLKQITLNFGCKNFSIQKFATTMLALEIIALKKSSITIAKKPNILFKIQKGQPAGCIVKLRNKEIYAFLTKLNIEILPRLKNFSEFRLKKQMSNFFFRIPRDSIMLQEFEIQYPLFVGLSTLDINIITNSKKEKEILFLVKSMKLPLSTK